MPYKNSSSSNSFFFSFFVCQEKAFKMVFLSGEKESQSTVNRIDLQEQIKKRREKLNAYALM